ncbi:alpha/beta fold hydrolase [Streptomonospora salina]|uniref:Pimeloyl-ACP methyl ester carboxylesterase n=1 Tax=Streptomonospora salina TaxID=104205 RepID=A0A841EIZ5_9ACTN|nr:alpha/beta hydrolase [Streptomonospora salina]MBB6000778.1 pimeloyl-ACP methyl ester carboxylesterase [Streptomonospora salina]
MTVSSGESHAQATKQSTLLLDGGEIHVYQNGPRTAPALLLIHGTAASARSWDPMVPLLTGSHHVIRIDLLGSGRSARPDSASYTVPDQAGRAGAALERLGVEHAVVVGHSSGGAVATALTEQRPDLVTALALINTGPEMDAYIEEAAAGIDPKQWPNLTDDQLRQAVGSAFASGFEIPRTFLEQVRDMDLSVFAATSQAVRAYLDERSLPERLALLGKPLLVLFGEEDRRWRPASADDYRAVPGAAVTMLPDLGHSPNVEDPPRTAAPLLAFTAKHAPQA